MKIKVLILLFSTVLAAVCIAEEGLWKVNWDQTAPTIQAVPGRFKSRFESVDEFRAYVGKQANGMTLEFLPNSKAILRRGPNFDPVTYRCGSAAGFDYWLEIGSIFVTASVGHGFKVTDHNKATLTFQIEWSEDVATRIPLLMEWQIATPQTPK